jgi:D-alanine-D-alanine ligase
MRIVVVGNQDREAVINRFGRPCPESYGRRTLQMVVDALWETYGAVAYLEGGKTMLAELERCLPAERGSRRPSGLVFNMAYGIQGDCRYTHVPAMLEMAGIPYTGSNPLGHALALDKVVTKTLIRQAGVPTPDFVVMGGRTESVAGLRFPLVVKPRHESTSFGLHLVRDRAELEDAVVQVTRRYQQEALVEEYIDGREVSIGLLGNDPAECLPPVELDFASRELRLMSRDDKYHRRGDEPRKVCPAPLAPDALRRLNEIAVATFRACHCRDYARVDIRIDASGHPYVLEINSMASLGRGGSFVRAAAAAGYSFGALVSRIVDVAHERCFGIPAPRHRSPAPEPVSARAMEA